MSISRRIRTLLVALSLILPSFTLSAGGFGGFVAKIWGSMMNPDPKVDSNYVYQPYKGIGASLGYQLNGNEAAMNTKIDFNEGLGQSSAELQMDMNPRKSHNASARR